MSSPQMPRPNKRKRQLQALLEQKRQKKEEAKEASEETHWERVRNIGLDSADDEEAVYTEMLLDEFGKAMQDVFEIFDHRMSEDGGQDHRTVISSAVVEPKRPKKSSSRLDESPRTKQRRFSFPQRYTKTVTELLLILI
jgi:hypothetical protein